MPKVYSKRVELKQATYDDLVAMRARLKEIIDSAKELRASTKTQLDEWRKERSAISAWVKRNEAEIEDAKPKDAETISTHATKPGSLSSAMADDGRAPLSFAEQNGLSTPAYFEGYVDDDDT